MHFSLALEACHGQNRKPVKGLLNKQFWWALVEQTAIKYSLKKFWTQQAHLHNNYCSLEMFSVFTPCLIFISKDFFQKYMKQGHWDSFFVLLFLIKGVQQEPICDHNLRALHCRESKGELFVGNWWQGNLWLPSMLLDSSSHKIHILHLPKHHSEEKSCHASTWWSSILMNKN